MKELMTLRVWISLAILVAAIGGEMVWVCYQILDGHLVMAGLGLLAVSLTSRYLPKPLALLATTHSRAPLALAVLAGLVLVLVLL